MSSYVGRKINIADLYENFFGFSGKQLTNIQLLVKDFFPSNVLGVEVVMPLSIGLPGEQLVSQRQIEVNDIAGQSMWKLGLEPMVSIKGANRIIRRYPIRGDNGGSIKERWSDDDYSISIKGFLMDLRDYKYPKEQVKLMRRICEHKGSVVVNHPLLSLFGVRRMAINDFDFPHTDGQAVQAYTISAHSDVLFDSLLEEI